MKCDKIVSCDGWHFHQCGKPAKYVYIGSRGGKMFYCGIHAHKYKGSEFLITLTAPDQCPSPASSNKEDSERGTGG